MAAIHDLLAQIQDEALRNRIEQEVERITKTKKFGLVFEEHLPECTPLFDMPIKVGSKVMRRNSKEDKSLYVVQKLDGDKVACFKRDNLEEIIQIPVVDVVRVAEFGEPIYPYLKPIDSVCNAPESELWHTLIEADNYHALQLLEYLYAGQVDCIYIDPPYNTRDKDWKYNNDYVDSSDVYKHSKWLSMMKKRLLLAQKLLNPKDSVLIVTIDEKEYLHLGCLLEELFPNCRMQMISSVINPKGNRRDNEFSRCEEYIFFVYFGAAAISSIGMDMLREKEEEEQDTEKEEDKSVRLRALLRGASNHGRRRDRPNLFYPLLFDKATGKFMGHGPVLDINYDRNDYIPPEGTVAMWPIATNGEELTWNLQPETLMEKHKQHFLSFSKWDGSKRVGYYLSAGQEENFKNGLYDVVGVDDDGAYIIQLKSVKQNEVRPLTIWHKKLHSASEYGTTYLNRIIGSDRFSFPKSIYAVKDCLAFFTANKPNALIVDFFAGSGTTLHATNMLNAEDGGSRRCILVTNNEVSDDESKVLNSKGFGPGDDEWEKHGIARKATWPRTVCTIEGHDISGKALTGEYLDSRRKMADGFAANAIYFKLGFLDKTAVALGLQFKELLPVLWMKAGAIGKCPEMDKENLPDMLILPQNKFAVLLDENSFAKFEEELSRSDEIQTAFLVTDYEMNYRSMARNLGINSTYQLYRDYLDNFRINHGRN